MNAITIDAKDNVAVAIEFIQKGETAEFMHDSEKKAVTVVEDITIYHKLAICNISKGTPIIKYGQHIGIAAVDIKAGEHVHEHNVESHREDL